VTLQEIFVFKQTGVSAAGMVEGHFTATGVRPRSWDRLATRGIELSQSLFTPVRREV
jgi:pilus assembly protein CpaF